MFLLLHRLHATHKVCKLEIIALHVRAVDKISLISASNKKKYLKLKGKIFIH